MTSTSTRLASILVPLLALAACSGPEETRKQHAADLVIHGGTIHSLDEAAPRPRVVVIRGGRVLALGGDELLERHADVSRLFLSGRTVVPGLIDAHAHLLNLGRILELVDLRGSRSFDEVLARVQAAMESAQPGEFIMGRGWNNELWEDDAFPTHDRLSAMSPDNPVVLERVDGHATLANARAMQLAHVTASTPDPPGGEIVRDAKGVPTGLFIDAAEGLVPGPPPPSREVLARRALKAEQACLRAGLTGVHEAGAGELAMEVLEELYREGSLRIRLNVMLSGDFDEGGVPAPWLARRLDAGPVPGEHGDRLSVTAVKLYADGALGSRGAALLAPYSDRPDTRGLLQLDRDELLARVRACRQGGFQAAVHAIGDAANRMALDVFAEVLGDEADGDHRFRIEHAQVIALDDIPRFAELGVIASVQPTHATSDMNMAEDRVGSERIRGAYAWRKLIDARARLALGSDFPVESEKPLWGLYSAMTRQDHDGRPEGGWHAGERLTAEEALRGFTLDAAFAGFQEAKVGSLSPGKWADFIVLTADPLAVEPGELTDMEVEATWIAGERVF